MDHTTVLISRRLAKSSIARAALLACSAVISYSAPASAYRPFDGTDAAVADPGEMEVEFQPAGRLRDDSGTTLIAPATVLNFGLIKDWEAVFEGQLQTPLSPNGPTSLSAAGAFLKHVVRPGDLQDMPGPSIATEFGVLLPDTNNPDSGYGASIAAIVSQRWEWGTIHLNAETALTREHNGDVFLGAIIEGPANWKIRPVAELFYENEFSHAETFSALIGVIWQVRDNLSFDVGLREALTNGRPVNELRVGVTFGMPLWPTTRPEHK